MESPITKKLLNLKEMAAVLGISPSHMYNMTDNGEVPYIEVTLGKRRRSFRYDPDDVIQALKSRSWQRSEPSAKSERLSA